MKNELKELVNDYVQGIIDTGGLTLDDLDYGIRNAVCDYIPEYLEDEDGDDIENPEFEKAAEEVYNAVKNDNRLYVFKYGSYAYEGRIKTLHESYICSNEYDNPFEDMDREI